MAECSECGDEFTVDDGCDDDGMCHPCAHNLAAGVVATRAARDMADELLVAADRMAHAVCDMLTHDLSAGSVINVENARKRYEALRPRNAPPLRPRS